MPVTLITANTMRLQLSSLFDLVNRALARFVALPLLWLYRHIGSPIATMLGSRCRFYPSCSHYAQEAFHVHGFIRGFLLSAIRLAKCNPLHPGGHDPVPPAKNAAHHGLHEQCSHQ